MNRKWPKICFKICYAFPEGIFVFKKRYLVNSPLILICFNDFLKQKNLSIKKLFTIFCFSSVFKIKIQKLPGSKGKKKWKL